MDFTSRPNNYNNVLASKEISSVQLYMSNNMFFNRYPAANVLKFFGAVEGFGAQAVK